MPRFVAYPIIATLLAFACPMLALDTSAEESQRITSKERKQRLSKLRTVSNKWYFERKRFPIECPRCKGTGTETIVGRGVRRIKCRQCDGRKLWIGNKSYRKVYYEMKSPAFQALPGIKDTLTKQFIAARRGRPWPSRFKRYRFKGTELVDDTHGIARWVLGHNKRPTESKWIWVPNEPGGKKGQWYLYDPRADGPWPERSLAPEPLPVWQDVSQDEHKVLRAAIGNARLTFTSFEYARQGGRILVRLSATEDADGRPPVERVGPDAIRLARWVLTADTQWQALRCEWHIPWKNMSGLIELKPAWISEITRERFEETNWHALDRRAQIERFQWQNIRHEGWAPCLADPEPKPEPEPEPQPEARPEPEQRPEPEPRPEPESQPFVAPPPIEPESGGAVPELSRSQRKNAEQAIARMRALFQEATDLYNESVQAKQAGVLDLWQEKMAEARSRMGELTDVWNDEIVLKMPHNWDWDEDQVADHYFGEIWNDVNKLKAILRKTGHAR